jgi:hypothetical protein
VPNVPEEDFGSGGPSRVAARPTSDYNRQRHLDHIRAGLAVALVVLVVLEVLIALIAVAFGRSGSDINSILDTVLAPTVALAGSAAGFYFAGDWRGR